MGYFEKNAQKLASLGLNGQSVYRECQVGAAWAALAHFTASSEPALISMPTGSGKTALMMMLSFLLRAERVVIVTPSVVLRDQTAAKFESLEDLKKIGAFPTNSPGPRVLDHQGQLTSRTAWKVFLGYEVIVATPHTTSPGFEPIVGPPEGLFGPDTLFFFDEAHHSRARTWKVLIDAFANNRVVLLTATPFRNDNRRLLAKLVYHYPMKRALHTGIYAPINYHAVKSDDPKMKDHALCRTAVRVYRRQRKEHSNARLLIRAEGVNKSAELVELYRGAGLKVEEVNYKQTLQDNKQALDGLRAGNLDAVVCIDQIGEGLDIPNLKIAVLHKPRQSFPATVQFVGRICREASEDIGEPHLIACPDDVRGRLQKLYTHDNSWREFVPRLVESIVGRIARRSAFHGIVDVETELDLNLEDIRPFFSVRIYRSSGQSPLTFDPELDLPEHVVPVLRQEIQGKDMLVLVTAIEKAFAWAEEADLAAPHFDLHVFYWCDEGSVLFEYSTSDKIAGMIRKSLWGEAPSRVHAGLVAKALREAQSSQYLMFGLSNIARGSGSIPSYKTYMGTEVEAAVRPSDSRFFTPGHALARYATRETRGIASNQARVWSIKRSTLNEFHDWCDRIAQCLKKRGDSRLPNVEFLPSPTAISRFPALPLCIFSRWDPNILVSFRANGTSVEVGVMAFDEIVLRADNRAIEGTLQIGDDQWKEETTFTYSLTAPFWHFGRDDMPSLSVDDGNEIHSTSLGDFLETNPPLMVLDDGSTVIAGSRFEQKLQLTSLPERCLDFGHDWGDCDIHVEYEHRDAHDPSKDHIPEPGKRTVQDELEHWLTTSTPRGTLIVKDHATGEIADFVEIQPASSVIRFYHCKACSSGKLPGARLGELKVLEQVLRTVNHTGNSSLVSDLYRRVKGTERPATKMVKGNPGTLQKLGGAFHPNEWNFEVAIVNPGIDCRKAVRVKNINTLLIVSYEWLAAANTSLKLIGS